MDVFDPLCFQKEGYEMCTDRAIYTFKESIKSGNCCAEVIETIVLSQNVKEYIYVEYMVKMNVCGGESPKLEILDDSVCVRPSIKDFRKARTLADTFKCELETSFGKEFPEKLQKAIDRFYRELYEDERQI